MIRKLLATTAVIALMSTGAIAADSKMDAKMGDQPMKPAATEQMKSEPAPVFHQDGDMKPWSSETGYYTSGEGQILASTLIGKNVYPNTSSDAEAIGDINDVVLSSNGTAEAVVVGVGGFLGIGEKDVAVDFDKLTWVNRDGDKWIVLDASREDLEKAPAYDRNWQQTGMTEPASDSRHAMKTPEKKPETAEATNDAAASMNKTGMNKTGMDKTAMDKTPATASPAGDETAAAETGKADTAMATPEKTAMATPEKTDDARAGTMSVDASTLSADALIGAGVYGANADDIGDVGDVLVSSEGGIEAFVIDVGGFLGIGSKPVALDPADVDIRKDNDGQLWVFTRFTEDQLERQVAYNAEAYKQDPDSVILR
ncbi:MAG: PRC-barrel domain-containing protein [Hyphomicrobiales bacterium]